uniref:Uncharacterized protein n=1 Tax=Rhizophora mucronata TaxID=61149 RepID=A0A2P2J0U5_RHIMU
MGKWGGVLNAKMLTLRK